MNQPASTSHASPSLPDLMAPSGEGAARRELLRQGLLARKGGRIGTDGRGVIALRFDDAAQEFKDVVLPLLRERGLPYTRVTTSQFVLNRRIPRDTFAQMQSSTLNTGGEVWNHGMNHMDASGDAEIYENLVGSLHTLQKAMPRLYIDCFAPPAGKSITYDGHMPSRELENFTNTFAGRVLLENHAIVSGYFSNTFYRPLDGVVRDGQCHYSMDSYHVARAHELVNRARDWRVGIVFMWHANHITGGETSLAEFVAVLDYLTAERDQGNILVLTMSGLAVADSKTDARDDILTVHESQGAEGFHESIKYPQFRQQIPGSTREFSAKVKVLARGTSTPPRIRITVGESTSIVVLWSTDDQLVRHLCTVPRDVTALEVKVEALDGCHIAVSEAHLLAV